MPRTEALRWLGSIGIFYVLMPLWVAFSGPLWERALPFLPTDAPPPAWTPVFWALALGGAWLAGESMRTMVRNGEGHPFDLTGRERLSRPTRRLLDRGVYAWSRNPMGLGDVLLYAGIAGLVGSTASLLVNVPGYAAVVWANHRFNERPGLVDRFGDAYLEYERTTSCLFPGPRSLRKLASRADR
jgi:protein-S-isoprenylcysteine O-methyltransferase Ste14